MKIKTIKSIKNYGIFSDFSNNSVKEFGDSNIIFGWNYSGKTTLSRIFRSLELKRQPKGFEGGKFKIQLENDTELTEADIGTNDMKVRVFNSDYIHENLKWEQLSRGIQPILIVGEENIILREKLEELNSELQKISDTIQKLDRKKDAAIETINSSLTSEASRITQELGLGRNFRKPDLETIVKSDKIESYLQDDTKFAALKKTAITTSKLGPVSEITIDANKSIGTKTKDLLKKTVTPSKTLQRLRENPELENWVRTGQFLHKTKTACEFCGNKLPPDLLNQLDSHFSLEYENFRIEIENFLKTLEASTIDVTGKLKSNNDFYPELQQDHTKAKDAVNEAVKRYNQYQKTLMTLLKEKQEKLSVPISFNADDAFDFDAIPNAVEQFNSVVRQNEERTRNFENVKKAAVEDLKKHYASQFYTRTKYAEKLKEIEVLESELQGQLRSQAATGTEIRSIESKISESVKGSEVLNDYVRRYFGNGTPIDIRVIDNQFHVYRDGKEAENLSEGEKTAISFAYFITTLHDKNTKDKFSETIVWVDDPISSLDHNHLYNTFSLISGCLKDKCEQLFLSTHNFEFFNLLKDDFAWNRLRDRNKCNIRANHNCKSSLYQINRTRDNSSIENIDCLLCRFKSEYQYIFYQLHEFIGSSDDADEYKLYTMPNMLRRFLETYIGFSVPSTQPWGNNLKFLISREEDMKFVYRLTNEMSHNEDIERALKLYNTEEIRKAINITFEAFTSDTTKAGYLDALRSSVGIQAN